MLECYHPYKMVEMAVVSGLGAGEFGAVELTATYDPSNVWWWVGVAAEVMAVGTVVLSPPAGLAAQILMGGSLL